MLQSVIDPLLCRTPSWTARQLLRAIALDLWALPVVMAVPIQMIDGHH
jgi:hypothetical protein